MVKFVKIHTKTNQCIGCDYFINHSYMSRNLKKKKKKTKKYIILKSVINILVMTFVSIIFNHFLTPRCEYSRLFLPPPSIMNVNCIYWLRWKVCISDRYNVLHNCIYKWPLNTSEVSCILERDVSRFSLTIFVSVKFIN